MPARKLKSIDLLKAQPVIHGVSALVVEDGAQHLKKKVIDLGALILFHGNLQPGCDMQPLYRNLVIDSLIVFRQV